MFKIYIRKKHGEFAIFCHFFNLDVLPHQTFCLYMLCLIIPFGRIGFVSSYVLSVYVVSHYNFCSFTFCLIRRFVRICFVALYLLIFQTFCPDTLSLFRRFVVTYSVLQTLCPICSVVIHSVIIYSVVIRFVIEPAVCASYICTLNIGLHLVTQLNTYTHNTYATTTTPTTTMLEICGARHPPAGSWAGSTDPSGYGQPGHSMGGGPGGE